MAGFITLLSKVQMYQQHFINRLEKQKHQLHFQKN